MKTTTVLDQSLYITFSNQKQRALKKSSSVKALDKVLPLNAFIIELFEKNNFEMIIDESFATDIIYTLLQEQKIEYFSYLKRSDDSIKTILNFILKSHRNSVAFDTLIKSPQKLQALNNIDKAYQAFKRKYALVDIADVEKYVAENLEKTFRDKYTDVYLDSFDMDGVSIIESAYQAQIISKLKPLAKEMREIAPTSSRNNAKIVHPNAKVFDAIDEIKTAIKIARKLLQSEDANAEEILIVASDIAEYAPLYKLYLSEYGIQGFSSLGTTLNAYHSHKDIQVKQALQTCNEQLKSLQELYTRVDIVFNKEELLKKLKANTTIVDEKIGVELTEANQILGLEKYYKHIIFLGTDINHFPPKTKDNFLYTQQEDVKYFYANDYFLSSQLQLKELKQSCEKLYIITAAYSGKRQLSRSILIDDYCDEKIDVSDIVSTNDLALQEATVTPDKGTLEYYKSIASQDFTKFDGLDVTEIDASHLSASQINSYLSCPLQYFYINKVRVKAPRQDEEGFDVMEQGSLMHLCYELFGKTIKEKGIKSTEKEELYELMYDVSILAYNHQDTQEPRGKPKLQENIHHRIFISNLQAGLKDERELGLLAKFVTYYIKNASAFEYFSKSEFEKEFALDAELKPYTLISKEDKNYFIKGFIDRFDNLDTKINIIDYKSKKAKSKDKKKQEDVNNYKDVQLALYVLYAKQAYPDKSYDAHLLSFKGNEKEVAFATLQEIEDERLKGVIYDTRDKIAKGDFSFNNEDEKVCEWCDVRFICHQSVLDKKGNGYE